MYLGDSIDGGFSRAFKTGDALGRGAYENAAVAKIDASDELRAMRRPLRVVDFQLESREASDGRSSSSRM